MKKFNDYTSQLVGESVETMLSDKAKLSLYKKSSNSDIPVSILEEVYRRGYTIWNDKFGGTPEQFAFDRVNSFIAGGFAAQLDEDLRNWFNPNHPEGGWKRINSKGEAIGPCAREPGEPKPKCMSNEKIAKLSKKERAAAVAAKRRHDPVADRPGKGGKPVNVSNFGKGKISEEYLEEKNAPTNPSLWSKAKSLARSKFDVYPSAYANGWAAKWYKSKGGGWKSVSEESELEEKCWTGYKQVGMKKKGNRQVPNCVPANEDAEAHSKDFRKPSSRFIGSNELVDIYKSQTPGQIIKKVVREHLEEDAVDIYTNPPERPAEVRQLRAPQKQAPRQVTSISGRASGRLAAQGSPMTGKVQLQRAAPPRAPTYSMPSGQRGSMSASPTKVTSSYSQGGVNVGKGMAASKQTSFVTRGMEKAGLEAVKKAAPAVAAGARAMTGVAGTVAGAIAPYAAKEVAKSYEKGHSQGLKPHDVGGEKYSDVASRMKEKSQGRSISSYEAEVLKPQKYDQPKPAAKVEVDAPQAPRRPKDYEFSFPKSFAHARDVAGGPGGSFEYTKGSGETGKYHTGYRGETVPKKLTPVEPESGGKTLKKIKEAISEATYKGKKVPLNKPMKGDVKKSKVYVDPDGDGKAQKVNFGDPNMTIKKDQPARKRSYCARSSGQGNLTDKTSANYWSRRAWNCEETEVKEASVEKLQNYSTAAAERLASGTDADNRKAEVNRITGIHTAAKKLHPELYPNAIKIPANEATIDELSNETLGSYVTGAQKQIDKTTARMIRNPGSISPADDHLIQQRKTGIDTAKGKMQEMTAPLGTTGKRSKWSPPMVPVRMASGKIEMRPPGKSGSSGGGNGAE